MLFKKKNQNQIKDERIEKESNKLMAVMFWLASAGLLALLVTKLVLGEPWYNFILEILCLVPAWGYALVKRVQSGVLVLKEKDEVLVSIRNEIMAKAYNAMFRVLTTGQFIYMLCMLNRLFGPEQMSWPKEMTWLVAYLLVDFIPSLIYTVVTIKKGYLVWGSKKREVTGKKEFAKRTALSAVFFGVLMGFLDVLENGFSMQTIILTVATGAFWGIAFYFMMTAVIKISEKNADKSVKEKEESNEE